MSFLTFNLLKKIEVKYWESYKIFRVPSWNWNENYACNITTISMQCHPHIYAILSPYLCNIIHISMQYYHNIYAMPSIYLCNINTISMQYAWPLFVSMRLPLGLWQRGSLAINTAMNTSYHIQEQKTKHLIHIIWRSSRSGCCILCTCKMVINCLN